jgi:signal transduction histidine kinase
MDQGNYACQICKFGNRLIFRLLNMTAESAPLQHIEKERLDTLYSYQVMDTPPEANFDDIIRLAVQFFNVPIAFISFIDDKRIWFKASHGIEAPEIPRAAGLCGHTILKKDFLLVTNALEDELAKENELVTGPPGLRFYASVPLFVANGQPLGTLCIADTQPRNMTAEAISHLKLLGAMAAGQLELRQQNQLLSNRQQDILAHLGHELKNSISLVVGYAALMKETDPGDENFSAYCDIISKAGNRMNALAEQALVLSANRSPLFELKKQRVELTPLIKETLSRFLLLAREKSQQLQAHINTNVVLEADPLKITEIIENLLSNAIKYTPFNKCIQVVVDLKNNDRVCIMIRDEGPGLTEFDFKKIFHPFTRLSAKPTGGESSTGMGLYIAHKLVEMHEGKIWAINHKSGGAAFYVELPCLPIV